MITSMIPNREFKLSELSKVNSRASEIDNFLASVFFISNLDVINESTIQQAIIDNSIVCINRSIELSTSLLIENVSNKEIYSLPNIDITIDKHGFAGVILKGCTLVSLNRLSIVGHGNFPDKLNPFGTPLASPKRGMGEKGAYPNYSNYRNGDVLSGGVSCGNGLGGTRGDGIVLINCSGINLCKNKISNFNGAGIQLGDNTTPYSGQTHNEDISIYENIVHDCYTSGVFVNFGKRVNIYSNNINAIGHPDNNSTDDVANPGYGIGVGTFGSGDASSSNMKIFGNSIVDAKRKALDFHGGDTISVFGNDCFNSMNAGASLAGATESYPRNISFIGNTFTNCGDTDFPTEKAYCISSTGDNCIATGNIVINASTPFYMNGDYNIFDNNTIKYTDDYIPKTETKESLSVRNSRGGSFSNNTISMKGASAANTYMISQFSTATSVATSINATGNIYEKGDAVGDNEIISNNNSNGAIGKVSLDGTLPLADVRVENIGDKKINNNIFETKVYITILSSNGGLSYSSQSRQGSGCVSNVTNTNSTTSYITLKNADTSKVDYSIRNFKTLDNLISRVSIFIQNSSILGFRIINNTGSILNTTSLAKDIEIEVEILHDRFYV